MKHLFGAVVASILLSGSVYGAQGETPFNLGEVMERVAHHPRIEEDHITIGGEVYQASFDDSGVILTSRDGEHTYRLPIQDGAEPYIKDGKVCYETPDGEIQFRGSRLGLKYQRMFNDPGFGKYLGDMVIGMKGDGDLAHPNRLTLFDAIGRKVAYGIDEGGLWIAQKDVASLQFPLTAEGEFLIDTNLVYVPSPGPQWSPSVAFDGTNYLVVWEDDRSGSDSDIYGARVNQSGVVLDPAGIAISTAPNRQGSPSVAFDGINYLVVWMDSRSGSRENADIYGARVNQSGVVLDPTRIAISTAAYDQGSPSVACDGTNYLVVWQDWRSDSDCDIYGARVDKSGVALDPAGFAISTAVGYQRYPSIACDGTNYLVVWEDDRSGFPDIYGARVDQSGAVLDPAGIAISTAVDDQDVPSVAFDGTNYLVVWQDGRKGSYSDIYGARVDQSGVLLDPAGIAISIAASSQWLPSVVFDDTNYMVMWQDYRSSSDCDIYGARVDQSGVVLDPGGIAISTAVDDQDVPSVAFDGTNYLVVWQDGRSGFPDIYGVRVDQSGVLLDPAGIAISTAASSQGYPSVVFDGTNYLVVWSDERSGCHDIYGARVNQSGVVLDPAGIAISTAPNRQGSPSVAFDGINYLVVWMDSRSGSWENADIYGAPVNQSGALLDPGGIAISTAASSQWYPSVAFDGTNYMVVWQDYRSGSDSDIYGARVNTSGVALDPGGIAISAAAYDQWCPSVAFDGTNYLVVWDDWRSSSDYDIYGARVNQSGAVLDPGGIAISIAANSQWRPSVVFDGTNYMVVWQDYRSSSDCDIYGARVDQSGALLDPGGIAISTAAHWQEAPSVVFDGTNYMVVWQDYRSSSDCDIYGARVNTSGVVIDSFAVSLQSGNQISPALAHGTGDQSLISYSGWTGEVGGKTYKAMRIWGKFYGVEEQPTGGPLPRRFFLEQNYPNPFNATTTICYTLLDRDREGRPHRTTLKIYNILGQEVRRLVDEGQPAGHYRVLWDGRDDAGKDVSSGVYFCRLRVKGDRLKVEKTRRMVLIR